MYTFSRRTLTFLVLTMLLTSACLAQEQLLKNRFSVNKGQVRRGSAFFTIQAIDTPGLVPVNAQLADFVPAVNRAASVGANSVCFTLQGLSDDGKTLSAEAVKSVKNAMDQITWRRLGAVIRVFGENASADPAWRLAAVQAVGDALNRQVDAVYWIEGVNCAELVAAFKKAAPKLAVAAREGGDILIVDEEPAGKPENPVMLVGKLPADAKGPICWVMPSDDASYAAIDKALADPAESAPYEPDNSLLTEAERQDGWVSLFDGKTFNGWWIAGTNKKGFEIVDGAITWARPGGGAVLTCKRYGNFILRVEWKINEGGNCGMYLRAPRTGRASKISMEFQMFGDYGKAPDKNSSGSVYDVVPPLKNASKPAGEWNDLEIRFEGPHFKATMNGEVIHDLNFDENEELKYRLREGFLGLQDHGNPGSLRNIRIKELP